MVLKIYMRRSSCIKVLGTKWVVKTKFPTVKVPHKMKTQVNIKTDLIHLTISNLLFQSKM